MATTRGERRARGSTPVSAELIEEQAILLFAEKTYPVIGMRDIGDAVGLLPGSLYVHISGKEDLLLRIVEKGIQNYLDAIGPAADAPSSAAERLRAAFTAHFEVLSRTREQTRVAFFQWTYLSPEKQGRVIAMRQRYEDLFVDIVRDGVRTGEFRRLRNPRVIVLAYIGMLNNATEWFQPDGSLSAIEVAEEIADAALKGIQA
ncbi:TetR/AcrR family transcriptional regulator [Pseudonocardia pini]|uniref:TetR/AcrR family transcriptional regulator n=1 Tax=Pseudonocardia pini TaxID=2758030 RepID=UPI001C6884C5|nr:TetR/AcrR family transcriptional regulator [Pseudonocardia pini]